MKNISKYFYYKEVTDSDTAKANKIDNTCSKENLDRAKMFANDCLDKCRELVNEPMIVDSWYRCEKLNTMVHGSPSSKHLQALAVDIRCKSKDHAEMLFNRISSGIARKEVRVDQLILEGRGNRYWIHIGYSDKILRNQILRMEK